MLNYRSFNLKSAIVVFFAGYFIATVYFIMFNLSSKYSDSEASRMLFASGRAVNTLSKQSIHSSSSVSQDIDNPDWDYPFPLQQSYELSPKDEFDVTLVTYFDIKDTAYLKDYIQRWFGPINIVAYYHSDEASRVDAFKEICNSKMRVRCLFYEVKDTVPINKLKNLGIKEVITSHFIFAESNLSPTTNLYNEILRTPGYLWREPTFVGVIPVYEWSSDSYEKAKKSYQNANGIPNGPSSLQNCLSGYECRPLQTSTVPLQFKWFSFINYRAMNCIETDTEIYMVLKKTDLLPSYDESVIERGYDNVEYVEKIRYSNMKIGQLSSNFFFRVSGIGVDSADVLANMEKEELKEQYKSIKEQFLNTLPNRHPIVECKEIEPAMRGWVSFQPYTWMKEEERDGKVYPKVAVKSNKQVPLDV